MAIQFIRRPLPNPPVTADFQAPPEVKQILKKSCYGCHSNETKLAWFDLPVPAYWIVRDHVLDARTHVNFSEIGKLPARATKSHALRGRVSGFARRHADSCVRRVSSRSENDRPGRHRPEKLSRLDLSRSAHHCRRHRRGAIRKMDRHRQRTFTSLRQRRTASRSRPTTRTGNRSAAPNASTTTPFARFSATTSPSKPSPKIRSTRGPTARRSQRSRGSRRPAQMA